MTAQQAAAHMEFGYSLAGLILIVIAVIAGLCYVAWRFWPV
jgi:hypothetical protein